MATPSRHSSMRKKAVPYWRDIAAVLSLKAFALCLIYLFCFASGDGLDPSAGAMFQHFASPVASGNLESAHD